jgi:hypothetical protein
MELSTSKLGISASKLANFIYPRDGKIFDIIHTLGLNTTFYWTYSHDPTLYNKLLNDAGILINNIKNVKRVGDKVEKLILESIAKEMKKGGA